MKKTQSKNASSTVQKTVTKAVFDFSLIENNDRILIAVSGGKDSTVLAWALSAIRKSIKKEYELEAIHISSDFCSCCKKTALLKNLSEWGIAFKDIFVPVIGRLKEGEKMNCYWCSTQRRTELLDYAVKNNFNKIALGHHLDDILETFFMNMSAKGSLTTMPILLKYRKYPVTLIRPLGYLEERQIIACAQEKDIIKAVCTCPFGANSKRKTMRKQLADFICNSAAVKKRMLKALADNALLAEN